MRVLLAQEKGAQVDTKMRLSLEEGELGLYGAGSEIEIGNEVHIVEFGGAQRVDGALMLLTVVGLVVLYSDGSCLTRYKVPWQYVSGTPAMFQKISIYPHFSCDMSLTNS